jgi:hypothetical protein
VEGAWVIKEGALASTGKANDIFTKEDIGDARIFFQVRQIKGDHKPCTTLFGNRPGRHQRQPRPVGRAVPAAQRRLLELRRGRHLQAPRQPELRRQAVAPVRDRHQGGRLVPRRLLPLRRREPLQGRRGPAVDRQGKKFPFDIMMHNGGLFDEYREIWIETSPKEDGFLSQK